MASGTFEATGAGDVVIVNERADLSLVFDGTGSVTLQRWANGGWRNVPDGTWTADTEDIVYAGGPGRQYRLNCTARSDDIHWELG